MCSLQSLSDACALHTTNRPPVMPKCLTPSAAGGVHATKCGTGWRCMDREPHASVLCSIMHVPCTPLSASPCVHECCALSSAGKHAGNGAMHDAEPQWCHMAMHGTFACSGSTLEQPVWGMPRPHLAKVRCGLHSRLASTSIALSSSWPVSSICSCLAKSALMAARVWRSSVRMSARPACFCRNVPTVQGPAW